MDIGSFAVLFLMHCYQGDVSKLDTCEVESYSFTYITQWDPDHDSKIVPYRTGVDYFNQEFGTNFSNDVFEILKE